MKTPSSTKLPNFSNTLFNVLNARHVLIFCVFSLLCIGTVMVASVSMPYAENIGLDPYFFFQRHLVSIVVALIAGLVCYFIDDRFIFNNVVAIYILTLLILLVVLVVGIEKNGSTRWLNLGLMTFQPSELAKITMAIFMADYVVRRDYEVKNLFVVSMIRLGIGLGMVIFLIALEPDLGSCVVIVTMALIVFFLAGSSVKKVLFITLLGAVLLLAAIFMEDYRLERFKNFHDPFLDPYGAGYQQSNSLMAYSLGGLFGVGLGQSVQKLSYLPEAHTDFMVAILGEELGFIGVIVVLALSFGVVSSMMYIGSQALKRNYLRAGYLAYGLSIVYLMQIFVNVGMTLSMIPTKGLTLPFISYGGSSLMICAMIIALILKIDKKWRNATDKTDVELQRERS